jgi:hypothetical protein
VLSVVVGQQLGSFINKENGRDLTPLREVIDAGTLTVAVDRTYPLDSVAEAIRYLLDGHARGKIGIAVHDPDALTRGLTRGRRRLSAGTSRGAPHRDGRLVLPATLPCRKPADPALRRTSHADGDGGKAGSAYRAHEGALRPDGTGRWFYDEVSAPFA